MFLNAKAHKTCLALMPAPVHEAHLRLFERLGKDFGFEVHNAADQPDRVQGILHASFVIADLSGNDPQVLYDLGIAHAIGKRVFIVTDDITTLAFDLASTRAWVVDAATDSGEIRQAMQQFLASRQIIGPVRLFLGKYAFFGENLIVRRLAAFTIDSALMVAVFLLGPWFVEIWPDTTILEKAGLLFEGMRAGEDNPYLGMIVLAGYSFLGYFMLSTWMLSATLGQLLTGLRVMQTDYRRVTFGQSVGRSLLTVLVMFTSGAAFLSALRGPGYRAVHDLLSGTIVVRRHPL